MAGQDAFGTILKRDTTGSGSYSAVANVSDLKGPARKRDAIEVTAHDSPNQYREFVKGLKDGGEVTATINYDPGLSSHNALDADFEEDSLRSYQLVLLPGDPNQHTWTYSALITDLGDSFPVDDRMEREVTFKISGRPVLSAP
jgi:predicted secreted protein